MKLKINQIERYPEQVVWSGCYNSVIRTVTASVLDDEKAFALGDTVELLEVNRDYVVCIKPVGLDSEQELPAALQEQVGGEIFTLHRLDKNVGGVMIYARNKQAAAQLSKAITNGDMVKEYVALVHGTPPAAHSLIP